MLHGESKNEMHANELQEPEKWFTFTFVREPITRFLSFYSNKILNQDVHSNHTFVSYERFGLLPNMTIDQVIDHLTAESFETEPHIVSQSLILDSVGFELSFIGKLDQLTFGLNQIQMITGLDLQLDHLNSARHKAVLPNRSQFERLAEYYHDDLILFDYPNDYESWYGQFIAGGEHKFHVEHGYTFQGEAKLLNHRTQRRPNGYVIWLSWRIHPDQSRKRVIRLVRKTKEGLELIWHLPPHRDLRENIQEDWVVEDKVYVSDERFSDDEDFSCIFYEVFFADDDKVRAVLTDYRGHQNMVMLPFSPIEQKT